MILKKHTSTQVPWSSLGLNRGFHGFPFRFPLTSPKMIFCSKKPCQIQGLSRRSTESGGGRLHIKLVASEQGFCRIAGQELSSRSSQDQTFQKRAGDVERIKMSNVLPVAKNKTPHLWQIYRLPRSSSKILSKGGATYRFEISELLLKPPTWRKCNWSHQVSSFRMLILIEKT